MDFSTELEKALKICLLVLAVALLLSIINTFIQKQYDWDIDHEIYFGQRLLAGELIWTKEFHDKLPFLQILFTIPAYFQSVRAFQFVSIIAVLGSSLMIIWLFPKTLDISPENSKINKVLVLFGALLYAVFLFILPGQLTTINVIASSFTLLSIILIFYASRWKLIGAKCFLLIFTASFFGTASISIRPYMLGLVAVWIVGFTFYDIWRRQDLTIKSKFCSLISYYFLWGIAFSFWSLLLNSLLHVLSDQAPAFFDGISMFVSKQNPQSALEGFLQTLSLKNTSTMFWFSFGTIILSFYTFSREYNKYFLIISLLLIGTFAEAALMLSRHYWSHYVELFVGQFSLIFIVFVSWIIESRMNSSYFPTLRKLVIVGIYSITIIICLISGKEILQTLRLEWHGANVHHSEWKRRVFSGYLKEYRDKRPSFLFPNDMYVHWKLNESRHGFPHAANTNQIYNGWWQNAASYNSFHTPLNGADYCDLVNDAGPQLIIVMKVSDILTCLQSSRSQYQLNKLLSYKNLELLIFKR